MSFFSIEDDVQVTKIINLDELLEENEIISPSQNFRLFATSNTLGAGDDLGIYHGTNLINQAQMDRWNIVASLNYLDEKHEVEILQKMNSVN